MAKPRVHFCTWSCVHFTTLPSSSALCSRVRSCKDLPSELTGEASIEGTALFVLSFGFIEN